MWKAYALFFLGIAFIALSAFIFELAAKLLFAKFRKEAPPKEPPPGGKRKDWLN